MMKSLAETIDHKLLRYQKAIPKTNGMIKNGIFSRRCEKVGTGLFWTTH